MSYRQRYNTSITIRGSVNASYPASENGGSHSVSYSHTEPIDVEIDVDTNPFDHSVNDCDQKLDILKLAVIGMNTAQIAAIKDSSRKVAKHVMDGFFGLVSSEISQQVSDLMNKVSSKLALLLEQKKASENTLKVMQRDYARLAGHYTKLFHNLDEEIFSRVTALDSHSFNFSKEIMHKLLFQSSLSQASTYAIESGEIGGTQTLIGASVVRSKVNRLLQTAHKYIRDNRILAKGLIDILEETPTLQITNEHLPVLIVESSQYQNDGYETKYYIPDDTPQPMKASIEKSIKDKSESLKWTKKISPERKIVEQEFYKLINDSFSNKTGEAYSRQRDLMIKLWQTSPAIELATSYKGV